MSSSRYEVHVGHPGMMPDVSHHDLDLDEAVEAWTDEVRETARALDRNREAIVLAQVESDSPRVREALAAGRPWSLTVDGYVHEAQVQEVTQ